MHESVNLYVGRWVAELALEKLKTLDIGSYDENGTNREWFTGEYVGLDMREGPGVDVVGHSWKLPFEDESFDVVVCTEMLEHDEQPRQTLLEVRRVLRPEGVLILTARGPGFPLHAYPSDYWRFTPDDFAAWFAHLGLRRIHVMADPQAPGTFGVAWKHPNGARLTDEVPRLTPREEAT